MQGSTCDVVVPIAGCQRDLQRGCVICNLQAVGWATSGVQACTAQKLCRCTAAVLLGAHDFTAPR